MKKTVPVFLLLLGSLPAFALVQLGQSAQNFGLTGLGPNATGQGEMKMSWGSCPFDGTTTTCTLSGNYSGGTAGTPVGVSGTYSFVVSYPGNGPFPLIAVSLSQDPNRITTRGIGQLDFVATLTPTNGAPINFYSFANFEFHYSSGYACTGVSASTCAVGTVGVTPNATINGPMFGSFEPAPTIATPNVITAGNYGAFQAAAPGSWIEIYGYNLATVRTQQWTAADFNGNAAPTAIGGSKVTVGGKSAFVFYVSPAQLNVQVPSDVPVGNAAVVVTTAGGSSTPFMLTINATEPGVLAPPASFVINGNQHVVALIAGTFTYVLPVAVNGIATVKAKAGDNLTLYGVGFGPTTPNINAGLIVQGTSQTTSPVTVTIGGVNANVTYQGLNPGYVGLYQFNIVVPSGVAAGDAVPVEFRLGGVKVPQALFIAIRN